MIEQKKETKDSSEHIEFIAEGELTMQELNEVLNILASIPILQSSQCEETLPVPRKKERAR